jgi:hypothetical protein
LKSEISNLKSAIAPHPYPRALTLDSSAANGVPCPSGRKDENEAEGAAAMETALVTGASRGVGRGVAASLAESGFRVFATGRHVEQANLLPSIVRIPCAT